MFTDQGGENRAPSHLQFVVFDLLNHPFYFELALHILLPHESLAPFQQSQGLSDVLVIFVFITLAVLTEVSCNTCSSCCRGINGVIDLGINTAMTIQFHTQKYPDLICLGNPPSCRAETLSTTAKWTSQFVRYSSVFYPRCCFGAVNEMK
jgi:hypothetical protein